MLVSFVLSLRQYSGLRLQGVAEAPPSLPPLLPSKSEDTIATVNDASRRLPFDLVETNLRATPASATLANPAAFRNSDNGGQLSPDIRTTGETIPTPSRMISSNLPALDLDAARLSQHGRNASHSLASGPLQMRGLKAKKSLPDLRQNHAQILDDRLNDTAPASANLERQLPLARPRPSGKHYKTSSNSSFTTASPVTARLPTGLPTPPRSANGEAPPPLPISALQLPTSASFETDEKDQLPPLREGQPLSLTQRRNLNGRENNLNQSGRERGNSGAYFRRLSMLPAFTISKAVPSSLLSFIDGIRGILFSLSQIFSSLKQFVVFPAPDRLPFPLVKVMASADDAMGFLIDALDRFDASLRRKAPETAVVKEVIETCRENVVIFGKLVAVLASHSTTLFGPIADVRYTRILVLALYGAMSEIANSWSALTPLKDEIMLWMRGAILSPTSLHHQPPTLQATEASSGLLTSTILSPSHSRPLPSPTLSALQNPINKQRPAGIANARRHAGSFTGYNSRNAS